MTNPKKMTIERPLETKLSPLTLSASPQKEELLIKITHTGICGTDLKIFDGSIQYLKEGILQYPHTPGHEWVGVVEEVGESVTDFQIGDRVTGECHIGCGKCEDCLNGKTNVCANRKRFGILESGSFESRMIIPTKAAHKIPNDVSNEDAVLVEPLTVAFYALNNLEEICGSSLVVFGLGPIGLLAAQMAKVMGAATVIGVDMNKLRLETGKEMGCDFVFNAAAPGLEANIRQVVGSHGPDNIIEASGVESVLSTTLDIIRPGGQLSLIGLHKDKINLDVNKVITKNLKIYGNMASANVWDRAIRLLASGKLSVDKLITHRFTLEDVQKAFETAYYKKDESIKVIVEIP